MVEAGSIEKHEGEVVKDLERLMQLVKECVDSHIEELRQASANNTEFANQFRDFASTLTKMEDFLVSNLDSNKQDLFKIPL